MRQLGRDQRWVALLKILEWSESVQGLVANCIVDMLPGQEGLPQGGDLEIAIVDLVELLGVGTLGPLHMAVELGGAGWQDEEPYAQLLAGLLEISLELGGPIHLDGLEGKRQALAEGVEETGRQGRGRIRIRVPGHTLGDGR